MPDIKISTKTEYMPFCNKTKINFGANHKNEEVKTDDNNEDTVPLSEMGLELCTEECYRIKPQICIKNTYLLESEEQLNHLIDKYNQNKSNLSDSDIQYYQNFIDKYNKTAETTQFEKNIDAKKAYLAFKKLDKYNYDTNAIPLYEKKINENNEMLGQYSNDYNELKKIINSDLRYKYAMEEFYNQLYQVEAYACFFDDDKNLVHKEAKKVLDSELSQYTNDNDKLDNLYKKYDFRNATFTNDIDNKWNNWCIDICITGDVDKQKAYLPEELVILHELYHVKQTIPGAKADYSDPFVELGAALDSVVKSDEIHKKINNIPLDEIVDYPYNFIKKDGTKINLGELVNQFRNIKQNHNCKNWEQAFMTQEGIELVKELF